MIFCESCGGELKPDAKFCTHCGAPVTPASQPESAPQREPDTQPVQGAYQPPAQPAGGAYQPPAPPAGGTYQPPAPPAGGTYQPPAPPAGGTYQPPTQQVGAAYQPPGQPAGGAYQSPAQPAWGTATALKEKKPPNKKLLLFGGIGAGVVILVVVLILALSGGKDKNGDASDPYLGVWNATGVSMMGMDFDAEEIFGEFGIELKSGGKGVLLVEDRKVNGDWKKEGGGVRLTVEGEEIFCEIDGATMYIEDYLGTGMAITLTKEGGSASQSGGSGLGGRDREDGLKTPDTDGTGQGGVQAIWNGSWYGYFWVLEGFGEWADSEDAFYDAYMVLDVDEEGYGTMAIFLEDDEYQTIDTYIYADDAHFEVTEGVFWDMDLDPDVWWLGLSPVDEGKLVVISDTYIDPELTPYDGFDYMCCFRPFGELWNEEDLLPPGYDDYAAAISSGVTDPNTWDGGGSSDSGGGSSGSGGEFLGENDIWGVSYYGEGVGDGDVLVETWEWARGLPSKEKPSYEEICERIGSKGKFNAPSEDYLPDVLYVKWETPDGTGLMNMTFQLGDDGELRYRSGGITGSLV